MATGTLTDIDPWLEPHKAAIAARQSKIAQESRRILGDTPAAAFALGYLHFGLHRTADGWVLREWAPNATALYLVGTCNDWQDDPAYAFTRQEHSVWELHLPADTLHHQDLYKLHVIWDGGDGYRIPAYARRVVQNDETLGFDAQVWQPEQAYTWTDDDFVTPNDPPLIYEAHVGMSSEKEAVATYSHFTEQVLPRIKAAGYNTVQLMAVAEHPYYGSFGYHVSNFFAPSSRFGTPDELKALVNTAHDMGLAVIMDLVHSHAVKNEEEGLSRFDGTLHQYFHPGDRGNHTHWDSRTFDYGKPEVTHFLLSNCRYWLDEFHFDGYRFDGVTSMLYHHHGMGKAFASYDDYFGSDVDVDALAYLTMANEVIHAVKPGALTIAEDMSAMPGLAAPTTNQGIGFDYRLSMGVPDLWIKILKEKKDEDWDLNQLFHELTTHRPEERVIGYAESHDQALVGDKTLIFRLLDEAMYWHMRTEDTDLVVERGIALHKLIRLLTASTNGGGYLNFMGNEFGHPEWIDFPREGNDWSFQYARRQWNLVDDPELKYQWLGAFDKAMLAVIRDLRGAFEYVTINQGDHVLSYVRDGKLFVYNLSPTQSFTDYGIPAPAGEYRVVLSSDDPQFGGQGRIDTSVAYGQFDGRVKLYLPARTGIVLGR
jgi:1,4-alpha-glucan branching enzyme